MSTVKSTVKKPADHQPKQVKPKVKAVDGGKEITFTDIPARDRDGKTTVVDEKPLPLTVRVLDEALDDFELLDDMRALDVDGNSTKMPAMLRRMVGDDYKLVMESLRDQTTGRVTITAVNAWINRLLEALNPNS